MSLIKKLLKPLGILTLAGFCVTLAAFILDVTNESQNWPNLFIPLGALFNLFAVLTGSTSFYVGGMGCVWIATQSQIALIEKNPEHDATRRKEIISESMYLAGTALSFIGYPISTFKIRVEHIVGLIGAGLNIAGAIVYFSKTNYEIGTVLTPLYLVILFLWGSGGSSAALHVLSFAGFLSSQSFLVALSVLAQLPSEFKSSTDKLYLSFFFTGSFLLSCVGMFLLWRNPKKSDEEDPLLHHHH